MRDMESNYTNTYSDEKANGRNREKYGSKS